MRKTIEIPSDFFIREQTINRVKELFNIPRESIVVFDFIHSGNRSNKAFATYKDITTHKTYVISYVADNDKLIKA